MHDHDTDDSTGHRLLQLGVVLFLLGLLTGFAIPMVANPRMGLTSHLEGVMNGMFLMLLGLLWPRLLLPGAARTALFGLSIYGTFANWAATLLAAVWGAGATMMPIAAPGREGSALQEATVTFLLLTLSLAIVAASVLILWGLRGGPRPGGAV
jgi:hydroxylaminobenzene mutase